MSFPSGYNVLNTYFCCRVLLCHQQLSTLVKSSASQARSGHNNDYGIDAPLLPACVLDNVAADKPQSVAQQLAYNAGCEQHQRVCEQPWSLVPSVCCMFKSSYACVLHVYTLQC